MKKTIISKFVTAACALSLLVSCTKTDEAPTIDYDNLVRLSSSIATTRVVEGQSWESTDAIGVTLFKRGESFPAGDDVNIKYVPEAAGASVDFNAAEADKALYFHHKYGTMDFVAYYPYNEEADLSSFDLDGTNTQVLFALTDDAVKGKPVALQFKSPYSQIKVNLKSSDGSIKSFDGAQITLKDVVVLGTYDILSGECNLVDEIQDLTYDASTSVYILPQDFTPSFEISLGAELGNYKVAATSELQAKENTIYSYTVDITLTGIAISGSIEGLVDKDMGDVDVEQVGHFSLSDFVDGFQIPTTMNTWIIEDEDATADSKDRFTGLRKAVNAAADNGREISLVFPKLTKIPDEAFNYDESFIKSKIKSISAPNVTTIGGYAFYSCNSLTSVDLPAAETIGDNAFYRCNALTSVDLPAATTIYEYAFYGCNSLTSVDLPAAETIGMNAFNSCTALQTLYIGYDFDGGRHASVSSISPSWLEDANDLINITLYIGNWNETFSDFSINGNVLTLSNSSSQTFGEIKQVN